MGFTVDIVWFNLKNKVVNFFDKLDSIEVINKTHNSMNKLYI